jgi:folate-binding protein YgfZ
VSTLDDPAAGYRALREAVGAVPVDRDALRVAGADAVTYLQGQLSQDVEAIDPGSSAWSLILQPQGKVDAWVRVSRVAPDGFVLDVDGGYGDAVAARLRRFLLRVRVDIESLDWGCVAVRGPQAGAPPGPGGGVALVAPSGWPALPGYDLMGPDPAAPPGVPLVGRAALEVRRIEAGVPRMGAELTDRTIPAEAGVIDSSVSFSKGCYTGQELVARIDSRGGRVPRRLQGLSLALLAEPGAPVEASGKVVGTVTSVAAHPDGGAVALAYISRDTEVPGPALVAGGAATIRPLPLVS